MQTERTTKSCEEFGMKMREKIGKGLEGVAVWVVLSCLH